MTGWLETNENVAVFVLIVEPSAGPPVIVTFGGGGGPPVLKATVEQPLPPAFSAHTVTVWRPLARPE